MPLQKQAVPINFAQGLDTKADPKQVKLGKFLSLQNTIFTTEGLFQKRNGYGALSQVIGDTPTYLTTFGGNLTAIGSKLNAYLSGSKTWLNKGSLTPITLSVAPVARSQFNQTQCDAITSSSGLTCVVYTEVNNGVSAFKYAVQDAASGQYIVSPTTIPAATKAARVFIIGGYFIIVSATASILQYFTVSISNPLMASSTSSIDSATTSSTMSWDGVVVSDSLYLVYNVTASGQQVRVISITANLVINAATSFAGAIATIAGISYDATSNLIYAAYYDSAGSTGYVLAVDTQLAKRMSPTQIISSGSVANITLTAYNGVANVLYESTPNNFIKKVAVTLPATVTTGTVGSTTTLVLSVGLASKAFLFNNAQYVLSAYQSALQDTYFLLNPSGQVIAKFAYQNGGGYLTSGLPQAQLIGTTVNIAYLYKDLIQTQSTSGLVQSIGPAGTSNIYSQTGVNVASMNFTSTTLSTSEIGKNLNLSGGILFAYDGNTLNEQNFHLFPDNITVSATADLSTTGDVTTGDPTKIKNLASLAGVVVGMNVTDTSNAYIPANTTVLSIDSSTQVTISHNVTGISTGDTIVFTGNMASQQYYYQVVYEWTDAQGNIFRSAPSIPVSVTTTSGHTSTLLTIPTARLTYKSGVKIVIYRWSVAQQSYYQVTSLTNPLMNDATVNSVTFIDYKSDAQILGNSLIYTTGGVVENIAPPSCTALTLFDDRQWLIDAEDPNLLWNSKQVIEGTPVEFSDLFTTFVAPTTGAQGSTGPMKCIFPMDDKLIIFKKNAIYWINGSGPDNTGSGSTYSQPIFITSAVGCSNQNSIVMTDAGLMFQSDKGIWMLTRGAQQEVYIGAPVEAFNSATVNSAVAIPGTTQVRFTLDTGVTLMYDYFYGQWGTFIGVPAVSSTLYNNLHTYISSQGIAYQETPGIYLDNGNPVLLQFTTSWLNLAGISGYERVYDVLMTGSYMSPHKIQVQIGYDYGPATQQSIINPTNFTGVYGSDQLYGQTTPYGGPGVLEEWKIGMQRQKCASFQISMQEVFNPDFGGVSGAGFTLSTLNCVVGMKRGFKPIRNANSVG